MGDDLLQETVQLRYPRLLASGVDYNDAQTVLGVCDNIPYKVRPLMADWMASRLGAQPV